MATIRDSSYFVPGVGTRALYVVDYRDGDGIMREASFGYRHEAVRFVEELDEPEAPIGCEDEDEAADEAADDSEDDDGEAEGNRAPWSDRDVKRALGRGPETREAGEILTRITGKRQHRQIR